MTSFVAFYDILQTNKQQSWNYSSLDMYVMMNVGHDMKNLRCLFMWERVSRETTRAKSWNGFKTSQKYIFFSSHSYFHLLPKNFGWILLFCYQRISLLCATSDAKWKCKKSAPNTEVNFSAPPDRNFFFAALWRCRWAERLKGLRGATWTLNSENNQSKMCMNFMKDWTINYVNLFFNSHESINNTKTY